MSEPTADNVFMPGNTAVITGASSGIGRASAMYCASIGMNVWMVDIDERELKQAKMIVSDKAKDIQAQRIEMRVVDVGDLHSMKELADELFAAGGNGCQLLMNNAGIGAGGGPLTEIEVLERVIRVNTYGPVNGCLAFLTQMTSQTCPGLVINTGSKQGITMPPGNLSYNVSKAALKAYTEGLEHDLMKERREGKHNVRAALLIPGWVNSSIMLKNEREKLGENFDASKVFFHEGKPASGAWMPQQVVQFMLDELNKGRFYIVCPDNDVDRETDNLRMTWTMQDITQDRPPLSRWHPDYKKEFEQFLKDNKNSDISKESARI